VSVVIGILILIVLGGPAVALAQKANRPLKTGGRSSGGKGLGGAKSRPGKASTTSRGSTAGRGSAGKSGRAGGGGAKAGRRSGSTIGRGGRSKPSWTLKAWNASGAPKTSETNWRGASAVLTGKAAGAVSRGGWRVSKKTGRAGKWFAGRAMIPFDRWLERKRAGLENAADLNDTTTTLDGFPEPLHEDVIHAAAKPREPKLDTRTIEDFTTEELLTTPRGRLALKEHDLKEMTAAWAKLTAAGQVDEAAEAEHMANRRRIEREIAQLRRSLNIRTTPEPAVTPPPVFVHPTKKPSKGEPMAFKVPGQEGIPTRLQVPPTLAPHLTHIHEFDPENDAELLQFLSQEVTGMMGYAEATNVVFDQCVTGKGLDPAALQGLQDYAEAFTEAAEVVSRAHKQFLAVYQAIIEAAANGTQMPYNGRFFSGESAA
jgi:hypothetical protein